MNELAAAAIAAYTEEVRSADQVVRNVERRRGWAERWRERTGTYPESYDLPALVRQLYASTRRLLFGLAGEPAQEPEQTAEILIHPTFVRRRKPGQGSRNLVHIQRRLGPNGRPNLPRRLRFPS